jgi:hypothetical protein
MNNNCSIENDIIKQQSDQMITMVDIINSYTRENKELREQLNKYTKTKNDPSENNEINKLFGYFKTQTFLFILLVIIVIVLFKNIY